jgi:hypothetical protein
MLSRLLAAAALLGACAALTASGADAAPTRGEALAYVRSVSVGPRGDALARWRDPICPAVEGLPRGQAEALLERLSTIAREVGAPLGDADCHANLYVVASADPKSTLRAWVKRQPILFGPNRDLDVDHMIVTDRPVRVWVKVTTVGMNGNIATDHSQALFAMQNQSSKPVLNWTNPTHLSASTARYISGAAVVLGPRLGQVSIDQLADYIALTTFAEVNLDADVGSEQSVLNLFRGAAAPGGLSAADQAYLSALYHVEPNAIGQRVVIADRMSESVTR